MNFEKVLFPFLKERLTKLKLKWDNQKALQIIGLESDGQKRKKYYIGSIGNIYKNKNNKFVLKYINLNATNKISLTLNNSYIKRIVFEN